MKCQIDGCGSPGVAKNFCDKHYRRWKQHGDAMASRAEDPRWGERRKHPLYQSWKWLHRNKHRYTKEWGDFWQFVSDVGERPENHTLRRIDPDLPFGPDNFYWKEKLHSAKTREERAAYQRKYRQKNPEAAKSTELKKTFGIDLDYYYRMLESQGGVCAICRGEQASRYKYYSVDHCHNHGGIRGLLCSDCNRALGMFKDDPAILRRAAEYIEDGVPMFSVAHEPGEIARIAAALTGRPMPVD